MITWLVESYIKIIQKNQNWKFMRKLNNITQYVFDAKVAKYKYCTLPLPLYYPALNTIKKIDPRKRYVASKNTMFKLQNVMKLEKRREKFEIITLEDRERTFAVSENLVFMVYTGEFKSEWLTEEEEFEEDNSKRKKNFIPGPGSMCQVFNINMYNLCCFQKNVK